MTMAGAAATLGGIGALLLAGACGGSAPGSPRAQLSPPPASELSPGPASPAGPLPSPSAAAVAAPDFRVVAYQGDQAFGGHEGHFAAVFAAGNPVVLLYFAGL